MRGTPFGWSARDLGSITTRSTTGSSKGWLKSLGRGVDRPQGDYRFFTDEALRRFVRKHPDQIDLRRVEKLWFIDLLAGLNISVPDFEGVGDAVGVG